MTGPGNINRVDITAARALAALAGAADTAPMSKRVAIFGDVGGHADALHAALARLGMDPDTLALPDDLTVVQVGDLVHRGPQSGAVLAMVHQIMTTQPDQWVQLVGNHEALYLPGASRFSWHQHLSYAGADLLNRWWDDGRLRVACGVATAQHGDLLVTHAGLTAGLWRTMGRPMNVRHTVPALNELKDTNPGALWASGRMLGGNTNWDAGPCWAEASAEVYTSWLLEERDGDPVPFGQVHGHSSAYWWDQNKWNSSAMVRTRFIPNRRDRHLTGVIGGRWFAGIDPNHGTRPANSWAPLVLDGRVVAR